MTRNNLLSLVFLAALAGLAAAPAQAQDAPIVVKQPKVKTAKFKGTVIHANRLQITVRALENERVVRTFQLSGEMQEKMQKIIDKGGYQYGDKVEIHHPQGSEVAVKIKGKPSKPL
jgi:hypothetical protein